MLRIAEYGSKPFNMLVVYRPHSLCSLLMRTTTTPVRLSVDYNMTLLLQLAVSPPPLVCALESFNIFSYLGHLSILGLQI